MQVHPGNYPKDLIYLKPREKFWNLSHLGNLMNRKRFERVDEFLKLDVEDESIKHRDMLFWARKLTK